MSGKLGIDASLAASLEQLAAASVDPTSHPKHTTKWPAIDSNAGNIQIHKGLAYIIADMP